MSVFDQGCEQIDVAHRRRGWCVHDGTSIAMSEGRLIICRRIGHDKHTQVVRLVTSHPFFGGHRLWAACPKCGRRVRGLVRRAGGRASSSIRIGNLVLDTHRMSASYAGRPIRLSQLEFRFLHYVAHQGGRAVSAGELAEHLYGTADTTDTNAIEALVVRLRRKIAPDAIETRRGFGYCLAGDSQ